MKLCIENLKDEFFVKNGYAMPQFDVSAVRENTLKAPKWVHFGAGNIFRILIGSLYQDLLNSKVEDTGIVAIETFDNQIVTDVLRKNDNLTVGVTLRQDGSVEKKVIASIVDSVVYSQELEKCIKIFESSSLKVASFTITEKGYAVRKAEELENIDDNMTNVIAIVTKLLVYRYKAGLGNLALISLDNLSHNGTLLKGCVLHYANEWVKRGFVDSKFINYLEDEENISFNWTMIDKITPRPSEQISKILKEEGLLNCDIQVTDKNTYTSAFVNAEECEYLAIENKFPKGAPDLTKTKIMITDKETIDKIEKMKVCTCLNPLHTVLAVFGCLLSYNSISEEMKDPLLKKFITKVGYEEGLPVVVNPGIIKADDFINEVIEKRLPNPYVPDTPQRIACDTSKKIPIRFGETLKAYMEKGRTDLSFLNYIPLFFAGYARYLMGVNDAGEAFELSPDPNLEILTPLVKDIKLGDKEVNKENLRKLFLNKEIFAVDLEEAGLLNKCEDYFLELISGKNAIKNTLSKYL